MTTMVTDADTATRDERLARWEHRTAPVMLVAAILPIVVGLAGRKTGLWIDLASWFVFVVDLVVHLRLRPSHLRTKLGVFDLVIVVLTAPWYLIPGFDNGRLLSLVRLGRLARVFLAGAQTQQLRALARRLGAAALSSIVLMVCCAVVVKAVEPASSGYETYGDALWWTVVTFTTVGYGDLFPVTGTGRLAGVLLMLGGIALIGSLAGTLGSFLSATDAPGGGDAAHGAGSTDVAAPDLGLGGASTDLDSATGLGGASTATGPGGVDSATGPDSVGTGARLDAVASRASGVSPVSADVEPTLREVLDELRAVRAELADLRSARGSLDRPDTPSA